MSLLLTLALLCVPADHFEITSERDYRVADLPISLVVTAKAPKTSDGKEGETLETFCGGATLTGVSRMTPKGPEVVTETGLFSKGRVVIKDVLVGPDGVGVQAGQAQGHWTPNLRQVPGYLSLVPPLLAILLALFTRQAIIALFAGVWAGAIVVFNYHPGAALLRVFDTVLVQAASEPGHAAILLFTMALGGMVGILTKSGGTHALVDILSKRARTRRSGLLMTWLTGLLIFFDDYANCLLVGNTVRPFTDKLRISREKLAYIVDSTAAPVATVAVVSTWVGYQIGLIQDLLDDYPQTDGSTAYDLFLQILPYSFYSFFTIFFVFLLAVTCRDFGPMLSAERRAIGGKLLRDGAQPMMDRELTEMEHSGNGHWGLAVLPIAAVIAIVAVGLAIGADSNSVLLWASFGGSLLAATCAVAARALTVTDTVEAWVTGTKSMVIAVIILVLAWSIGDICKEYLHTGPWVADQFHPSPHWVPAMTFLVSALIALATGSSFGTMAIVIPIAGPMAWTAAHGVGLESAAGQMIWLATLGSVLGGAVFGDHCSPISDTTIMSSMSCGSDHIDHVRTQAPYAGVCAGVAILVGYLPAGFGVSPLFTLPVGLLVLLGIVRFYGQKTIV